MLPPAGNGQFIIQALPQQGAHGQMGAPQLQQVTISQASIPTMIQQPQGQQQVRVRPFTSVLDCVIVSVCSCWANHHSVFSSMYMYHRPNCVFLSNKNKNCLIICEAVVLLPVYKLSIYVVITCKLSFAKLKIYHWQCIFICLWKYKSLFSNCVMDMMNA